jgi:predicted nucleic acid-binding protein
MDAIFVDTGFWFALISRKDPHHEAAKGRIYGLDCRPLLTSNAVFSETATLLLSRISHADAVIFGNRLLSSSQVRILRLTEADEREAWRMFGKYGDQKFSFADCTSFALMRRLGVRHALAFDGDFEKMGFGPPDARG